MSDKTQCCSNRVVLNLCFLGFRISGILMLVGISLTTSRQLCAT